MQSKIDVTNPYLEPVASIWSRIAGIALLASGVGLTAGLGYVLYDLAANGERRRMFTSSSLASGLILLALCGICWQAGYRLTFHRPDGTGTLFSRPAWFAIGAGLVVITALMAGAVFQARKPTVLDLHVLLILGAIGVWCLVLALRGTRVARGAKSLGEPAGRKR